MLCAMPTPVPLSTDELAAFSPAELLRHCVQAAEVTLPELREATRDAALQIDNKPAALRKWLHPAPDTLMEDPLHRADVILRMTSRHEPLEWLCARLGGVFVFSMAAMSQALEKTRREVTALRQLLPT